jgi:hypothetical protein
LADFLAKAPDSFLLRRLVWLRQGLRHSCFVASPDV